MLLHGITQYFNVQMVVWTVKVKYYAKDVFKVIICLILFVENVIKIVFIVLYKHMYWLAQSVLMDIF